MSAEFWNVSCRHHVSNDSFSVQFSTASLKPPKRTVSKEACFMGNPNRVGPVVSFGPPESAMLRTVLRLAARPGHCRELGGGISGVGLGQAAVGSALRIGTEQSLVAKLSAVAGRDSMNGAPAEAEA